MFGINTGEEMPASYLADHDAWDKFIGSLWRDLFQLINFVPRSTVIEIGPGTSLKIGYALAKAEFCGELYLVDVSRRVLEIIQPKYKALLPQAKITSVCSPVKNCQSALPHQADFLFGSHIIDDMLLHHGEPGDVMAWAEAYTHAPSDSLQEVWTAMEKDKAVLNNARDFVRDSLLRLIENLSPRGVILNQYPSSTLYEHGMASLNDCAFAVFDDVKARYRDILLDPARAQQVLSTHKNYGNRHLGEHILNANYWMLLCPPKSL